MVLYTIYEGENVGIGEFMFLHRGLDADCFKAGTSTHNQRIERFWGDSNRAITEFYWVLFTNLSNNYAVDFGQESHVFVIHHLFLDCINEDLQNFKFIWNNHKLRTEHNKSPAQLLFENQHLNEAILLSDSESEEGADDINDRDEKLENDDDHLDQVVLEPIKCPLTDHQRLSFEALVPKFVLANMSDETIVINRVAEAFRIFDEIVVN